MMKKNMTIPVEVTRCRVVVVRVLAVLMATTGCVCRATAEWLTRWVIIHQDARQTLKMGGF